MRGLWIIVLCLLAPTVPAGEIHKLQVDYKSGVIRVVMDALIQARSSQVEATLDNYENLRLLIPVVTQSVLIPSQDAQASRVQSRIEGCVWFVCADLKHVMDVRILESGLHEGQTIAELSDFESGYAQWRLQGEGEATRLRLDAQLKPRLWVPPLLGPVLLKRKIRRQFRAGIARLEHAARAQ